MSQPKYRFYATLLDSFYWFLNSESETAEQEFIDKINRVPITDEKALERMNKGTELNNLVDMLLVDKSIVQEQFKAEVVDELLNYLDGSVAQHRTETIIRCNGVDVLVYGVADYIKENKCIDLKTTSSYDLGKYKDSLQRHLYPVSLFNEGVLIDEFEFLVTDFNSVFKEPYKVDLVESNAILSTYCSELIDFIESKRHLITDTKIFHA
jgi:hypothetical protein